MHRFGRLVTTRRRELSLSLIALRNAGGPVPATTSKIERGLEPKPALATFQRLDQALQWVSGSAARAWNGGTPTPVEAIHDDRPVSARPSIHRGPTQLVVSTELLPVLTRIVNRIREGRAAEDLPDSLTQPFDELDAVVARLNRSWLISYTEQRLIDSGTIDNDPLLTVILEPQLDSDSFASQTEYDRQDAVYLKWLLGRRSGLTEDQLQTAQARWAMRREHHDW